MHRLWFMCKCLSCRGSTAQVIVISEKVRPQAWLFLKERCLMSRGSVHNAPRRNDYGLCRNA